MTYAIIKDNVVINRCESETDDFIYPFLYDEILPDPENILQIGMINTNGTWVMPEPVINENQE